MKDDLLIEEIGTREISLPNIQVKQNKKPVHKRRGNGFKFSENNKVYDRKSALLAIAKYITYFAMMILLYFAKSSAGLSPFSLGFFVGLVYCRENVFALSIAYILSSVITGFTVQMFVIAILPAVIFIVARVLHQFFMRPMKMLQTNLYALLCQLPVILFNIGTMGTIVHAVCCVVISQIFTYTATIALYAMIVRGAKYRLAKDELFGLCTLVTAIAIGLFAIDIFGFKPFYFFAAIFQS